MDEQAAAPDPAAPGASAAVVRRRRHWALRLGIGLGLALGGVVLLLALLLAGGWAALRTEAGTGWLLSQVKGLRITDGHGSLRGGPFRAARLEFDLEDSPVHVRIDNLAWRDLGWKWRPYPGAWTGLVVEGLQAQRVEIRTRPTKGPKPPPTQLRMPIELHVPNAQVQLLQVDTLQPFHELRFSLHLGTDNGRLHQVDDLRLRWERLQLQGQATLGADKPMPLKLQAGAQSLPTPGAGGVWATPWTATVNAEGPLAALAVAARLRAVAPATAALDLQAGLKPFETWPLSTLQARAQDLDLAMLADGLPVTRLSGRADIETRGADQPARVQLQLANALAGRWDEQRLPLAALQLDARAKPNAPQQVELTAFDLQLGSAAAPAGRWRGCGRWDRDHLQVDTRVEGLQPARLDRRAPRLQLSGPLQGTLKLRPQQGFEAAVDTRLEGALDATPRQRIALTAAATVDQRPAATVVVLKQLDASAGGARAQGEATLQRQQGVDWQLSSRGSLQQFDPALWWPGPEGGAWRRGGHRLNGRWEAELVLAPLQAATWPWPGWRGHAAVTLADSTLAGVPLKADARWSGAGRAGTLKLDIVAAGNHAVLDGERAASGDRWRADLDAPSLTGLAPLMALAPATLARQLPTSGRLALRGGGTGAPGRWTQWRWDGDAQASELKSPAWRVGRAQARWRFAPAPEAPLELQLDAEALAVGAQSVDRLQAQASGSTASHRLQLQADSVARPPAWADLFVPAGAKPGSLLRAQGQGGWRADAKGGRWQGTLERLRAGPPGAEGAWLQADALRAAIEFDPQGALRGAAAEPGRLLLLGTALRWSELRWQAGGEAGLPRLDVQAELEPLRVAPLLATLQPDFGWGGDLVVRGKAQLHTREAFSADVVLERVAGDLAVTDEGGTHALGLTDLRLGWVANQGTWHFSQAVAGKQVGVLGGAQSLRMPPRAIWPTPETPMEGVLELRVDNLGIWGAWTPPGWRLSGNLHVSASVGGRFKAPEYTGRLQASGLGVRNLLLGVNAHNGEVRVALKGPTAQIERFVVKGGDGELQLQGGASFGDAPRAQLKLDARRFQVLGRVDRRIVASGAAEVRLEADALRLDGKFHVDEGLVDFSRADAPTLDEDVTVVRRVNGRRVTTSSEQPAPEPAAPQRPGRAPREVHAALDVDLGEQLHIRGRGLDAYLRGQLRVTTPNNRLAVSGSVRTENGTYAAYGQKLEIERGQVSFLGPVENPRLDILALRPNMDIRVGVAVGGTALKPRVRLYSEPEMSDSDKLSWLVLGRAPEGLGRADTALLQRAAMALLAGEEGGSGDKVIKALGLDEFSVRQEGEGELRNTVVALGKQVSRRWYVGYERGINSTVGTWQAIYRIAQKFTLRGQTGEDNAVDLIWTWRWN
jgi:translocation and assembly module TamB